jgi:hypothetical protein
MPKANISPFTVTAGGRPVHPLGPKCEESVQRIVGGCRRLDAEQLQIVEIIVKAFLRGAL